MREYFGAPTTFRVRSECVLIHTQMPLDSHSTTVQVGIYTHSMAFQHKFVLILRSGQTEDSI
jgi:hypothetical protein